MNTAISMIGQMTATEGLYKTPAVSKGKKAYSGNPTEAVLSNFPNSAAEVAETLSQNIADTKNSVEKVLKTSDVVLGRTLQFSVNQELGRIVIKVIDPSTQSVIREIPSEDMQKLQAYLRDASGLLFDENV
ncbi:MAG: flagellar protein FlaG [Treponema sp.]|nr:flagellar protein FlaG [Treponema sp.]MCR5622389.1 flagellar protein FlaG [Treponema sp.]